MELENVEENHLPKVCFQVPYFLPGVELSLELYSCMRQVPLLITLINLVT